MSPASLRHQLIVGFLYKIIDAYVEHHRLGITLNAPFKMKLPGYGAEPDVLVVLNENGGRLRPTYLNGPADLVVEVISPDSVERDRVKKYGDYEAAGVNEYWLIDPEQQTAEFYRLSSGRYAAVEPDADGWVASAVLSGFRLRVAWLFQSPLPKLLDVLADLKIL